MAAVLEHLQEAATAFGDDLRRDATCGVLATASPDGQPHARYVLFKQADAEGVIFYTNYASAKGREIAANPKVAVSFHWFEIGVQIRLEGALEKLSASESDAYFQSRPRGSRVGAWASQQSAPIESREALEASVAAAEARFGDEVPRPEHWGGYRLRPVRIELWYDGAYRLHDRFVYERSGEGWEVQRLSP